MRRQIAVVGAATSIGIRPYDDREEARQLYRAPSVLRELGLISQLGAADLGDVTAPPYQDFVRPSGRVRNEEALISYTHELADRVAPAVGDDRFALVLGGDCSIVLGSLLGATRRAGRVGLMYIDAHADFATPAESATGSAASMCLALAVGRGDSPLARLGGSEPLVRADNVALIGRRDNGQPYGHDALAASTIYDVPDRELSKGGGAAAATSALERIGAAELGGFWIHVDADVLEPRVMPAVDSPEPGGPGVRDLASLVRPLARHAKALGLQLTIYDPALDADRSCARRLVELLETVLADGAS